MNRGNPDSFPNADKEKNIGLPPFDAAQSPSTQVDTEDTLSFTEADFVENFESYVQGRNGDGSHQKPEEFQEIEDVFSMEQSTIGLVRDVLCEYVKSYVGFVFSTAYGPAKRSPAMKKK